MRRVGDCELWTWTQSTLPVDSRYAGAALLAKVMLDEVTAAVHWSGTESSSVLCHGAMALPDHFPGVYARVAFFTKWINANP